MNRLIMGLIGLFLFSTLAMAADSDVSVSNFQVMVLSKNQNNTKFSMKVDVENTGEAGQIYIDAIAKNSDGFQVDFVKFSGGFMPGEKKTLTAVGIITNNQADTIRAWEIQGVKKYRQR